MDDKLSKPVRIDELKAVLQATGKIGSADRPSPASGSDLPVCDERQLDELLTVGGGDGFVSEVLKLFIEQAEQLASQLPALADSPEVLASEAHKLRGAAGYAGATRAAYYCTIVENAPPSSPSHVDQKAVADLKESLILLIEDYRKRLNDFRTMPVAESQSFVDV